MHLGKMKRINDLRAVWQHEARNFSKWLALEENLQQLSEAIGVDIVFEELEASVGSFNVDLYAVEDGTERKIIIENQLEDTNHDHLGKLITYASGKGAEIIIWIVKHARDEHRQAIEWLNQNTGVRIGFFLIEIELWQIDNSAIAPKFNIVEQPNDWVKQMKNINSLSENKLLQLRFWQQLCDVIRTDDVFVTEFSTGRKPRPQHWYDLGVGVSSYHVCLTLDTQKNCLGAGLYIPDNKDKFELFKKHAKEIEVLMKCKVEWREAAKATRIMVHHSYDISNENQWKSAFEWLMNKALLLKKIVKQFDR